MFSRNKTSLLCLTGMLISTAAGQDASPAHLTAREVFYKEENAQVTAPKTPSRPKSKPAPAGSPNTGVRPSPSPVRPADIEETHPTLVNVSTAPLGIRMSIVKMDDGRAIEMDPDGLFHAGDTLRLSIEVSDLGYLYVVNRGSSGTWQPLFPIAETPKTGNEVRPGTKYQIPQGAYFTVTNPAGVDKLFVIFSRNPNLDLDSLVNDISKGQVTTPKTAAPYTQKFPTTYAANTLPPLNDAMVDRLRDTYARDLVIEKVDEKTPGPQKEKAVYAVNMAGGPNARVVLDVQIKHP